VIAHSQGRYTFYQVSDSRVTGFLSLADELLADVARGVSQCTHYASDESNMHEEGENR
jgi:ArsR family transcriptional regulator, cadmium/lead-responsive transcriptional repressor